LALSLGTFPFFVEAQNGQFQKVDDFYVDTYAVKSSRRNGYDLEEVKVELIQTGKSRTKEDSQISRPCLLQNGRTVHSRLRFQSSTANNARTKNNEPNPNQQYYRLVVALFAISQGVAFRIFSKISVPIIVRGRNPGRYSSNAIPSSTVRKSSSCVTKPFPMAVPTTTQIISPSSSSQLIPPMNSFSSTNNTETPLKISTSKDAFDNNPVFQNINNDLSFDRNNDSIDRSESNGNFYNDSDNSNNSKLAACDRNGDPMYAYRSQDKNRSLFSSQRDEQFKYRFDLNNNNNDDDDDDDDHAENEDENNDDDNNDSNENVLYSSEKIIDTSNGWRRSGDSLVHMGKVGINVENPQESLCVDGNILLTGAMLKPSDRRLKQNISQVDGSQQLKNIKDLQIYDYDLKGWRSVRERGVIAQDVEKLMPYAVEKLENVVLPNGQVIQNLLVVNERVLLFENIGATQHLSTVVEEEKKAVHTVGNRVNKLELDTAMLVNGSVDDRTRLEKVVDYIASEEYNIDQDDGTCCYCSVCGLGPGWTVWLVGFLLPPLLWLIGIGMNYL